MNVVVDHGNSAAKIGIFDDHVLKQKLVFTKTEELQQFLINFSGENIIISSVNHDTSLISGWAKQFDKLFILTPELPLPIRNQYGTPGTLGMDRLAAVCGAWHLYPNHNCLVIDAGSCLTFEILDSEGRYLGGSISPGLRMRLTAMHKLTARLPLIDVVDDPPLIGNTTASCMQSGAINGMIEEIRGIIHRYQEEFDDLKIILCGGDTPFFENKLKASIFASPELVLSGLNSILSHNAKL